MPETRGIQATDEVKSEWSLAYKYYLRAPGDRFDKKKDRTQRIDYVAQEMKLTRKQAKRRIRNYEAWQRNIKKGIVPLKCRTFIQRLDLTQSFFLVPSLIRLIRENQRLMVYCGPFPTSFPNP